MRIISGKNKGKVIVAPRNLPVRPTTDFAKEALFNLIRNHFDIDEISVLDLFAGTGNISYELASREAAEITSVDAHFGCVKFIRQTAEKMNFSQINAVKADAIKFCKNAYKTWDLIFADPPYDWENHIELVDVVFEKTMLAEEGILIVEHSKDSDLSEHPNFVEHRKYGNVHFSFFEHN